MLLILFVPRPELLCEGDGQFLNWTYINKHMVPLNVVNFGEARDVKYWERDQVEWGNDAHNHKLIS